MTDDIRPKVNVEAFATEFLATPKEGRAAKWLEIAAKCNAAEVAQVRRALAARPKLSPWELLEPKPSTAPAIARSSPPVPSVSPSPLSTPAAIAPTHPAASPSAQGGSDVAKPLSPYAQKMAELEAKIAKAKATEPEPEPAPLEPLPSSPSAKGGGEQTGIKSPDPKPNPEPEPASDEASPSEPKSAWTIKVDAEDPYQVAFEFLASRYTLGKVPLLRCWRGDFLRWTGTHYTVMDDDELTAELWDFLSKINGGKLKPQQQDVNQLRGAIKARVQLKAEIDVGTWLDDKSTAPWGDAEIIVCKNRVVRLSDGAVWPHNPRLFVTNAIDTDYLPNAAAPRFTQFLNELWADDDTTRNALQEFFGLVLTDVTRFQKGFIIVGPARSGKSTLARTLRNLLGASNYCGPNLAQLSKDFGLEPLIGKKIAVIPDARTDARTNRTAITERLLSVIGEDPQDINRKNAKFWQGILRARVMILSNELPDFKDDTGVIATRFIILQMYRSFLGKEDTDLEKKLILELSGILNWAVAGWQRLVKRGKFIAPGDGKLNDELAGIGSSICAFVAECCELGAGYQVVKETLYFAYRQWCITNGFSWADRLPSNLFSGKLRSAFPGLIGDERPRKDNPGRKWHYVGIRLHGAAQPMTRQELLDNVAAAKAKLK